MPTPGDVLCDDQFQFSDGKTGKKLFVVLNNAKSHEPCLVVKTTSQSQRYPDVKIGCNSNKKVFYCPQGTFLEDTYIQLEEIFPYLTDELLKGYWEKRIRQITKLQDLTFRQLKNCLKTLKDDIPIKYYKMIFR